MTKLQIQRVQERDRTDKERYIALINAQKTTVTKHDVHKTTSTYWLSDSWAALKQWWRR